MTTKRHALRLFKLFVIEAVAERVEMVRMPKMVVETRGKMAAMADNQPSIFCTICCRYGIKITFHTLQHYFCPLTLLCSNILNLAQI